jgi:hypothetical protein
MRTTPQRFTLKFPIFLVLLLTACSTQPRDVPAESLVVTEESPLDGQVQVMEPTAEPENEATPYPYTIVDTGQDACFDETTRQTCPGEGERTFGQDAQYTGNTPAYLDNGDGTVTDLNTGLIWIQDPGEKMRYDEGIELGKDFTFAGYDDWRVPTIKELYSLINFSGIDDAEVGTDAFIDRDFFVIEYGDTSAGERPIDSQWITSTIYGASVMGGQECFFGVNFADGRIKCYPTQERNNGYYLRLVRGESYGQNAFVDNGNGTITDAATGLTWHGDDSGEGMDWGDALSYCESLTLAGYDDWRLPNATELQSIVDYTKNLDQTSSPAIDPIFGTSSIVNEAGEVDYPNFWTSTTHESRMGGSNAVYIAFGRALGNMRGAWEDVHGAGAQRSDPKTGDPTDYPTSRGPQGDAVCACSIMCAVCGRVR